MSMNCFILMSTLELMIEPLSNDDAYHIYEGLLWTFSYIRILILDKV